MELGMEKGNKTDGRAGVKILGKMKEDEEVQALQLPPGGQWP